MITGRRLFKCGHSKVQRLLEEIRYTYCPVSRKGNQTMKFGQLVECNKINIFLQKLWGK